MHRRVLLCRENLVLAPRLTQLLLQAVHLPTHLAAHRLHALLQAGCVHPPLLQLGLSSHNGLLTRRNLALELGDLFGVVDGLQAQLLSELLEGTESQLITPISQSCCEHRAAAE